MTFSCLFCHPVSKSAEMVEAMKKVATMDVELTVEERNLLSGELQPSHADLLKSLV